MRRYRIAGNIYPLVDEPEFMGTGDRVPGYPLSTAYRYHHQQLNTTFISESKHPRILETIHGFKMVWHLIWKLVRIRAWS